MPASVPAVETRMHTSSRSFLRVRFRADCNKQAGERQSRPRGKWSCPARSRIKSYSVKNLIVARLVCFCSVLLAFAVSAFAQQYPAKPVRIIVPAAPGGGTDLIGRVFAQKFSKAFAQSFVVDNRGGAGTTLGTDLVAKSPPDGHTLLLTHVSLRLTRAITGDLPYRCGEGLRADRARRVAAIYRSRASVAAGEKYRRARCARAQSSGFDIVRIGRGGQRSLHGRGTVQDSDAHRSRARAVYMATSSAVRCR